MNKISSKCPKDIYEQDEEIQVVYKTVKGVLSPPRAQPYLRGANFWMMSTGTKITDRNGTVLFFLIFSLMNWMLAQDSHSSNLWMKKTGKTANTFHVIMRILIN